MIPSLLLISVAFIVRVRATPNTLTSSRGVPGTTSTRSGYDTELGKDPICWLGKSVSPSGEDDSGHGRVAFGNTLVEDYELDGEVTLFSKCPPGVSLSVEVPTQFQEDGYRPRTHRWYNYTVRGEFNLDYLEGYRVVSDQGTKVMIQIILCELGKSGFCSPFVHEQAAYRLIKDNITESQKTGDRHGGTHIHSPAVLLDIDQQATITSFQLPVKMLVNEPGEFYAIGSLQFYTGDARDVGQYRYDIANAAVNQTIVNYQDPATIHTTSTLVCAIAIILCATTSGGLLHLFIHIIQNRKNDLFKLSQGAWLAVMVFASMVATASATLLHPKNDTFCNLQSPLTLVPLTVVFSITTARVLRMHANIDSDLLKHYRRRTSGCMSTTSIFGSTQVDTFVFLATLPQVTLQISAYVWQPKILSIAYNEDETEGRLQCVAQNATPETTVTTYCLGYTLLLALMLLVVSYASRNLPSLLAEVKAIFVAMFQNVIVFSLGIGIVAFTASPTMSPDFEYILWISILIFATVNLNFRIVWPKLQMVWTGSNLLVHKYMITNNAELVKDMIRPFGPSNKKKGGKFDNDDGSLELGDVSNRTENSSTNGARPQRITLNEETTPNPRLLLRMVELQEQLHRVNRLVMSGVAVDREEWEAVRKMTSRVGTIFQYQVAFSWETPREEQQEQQPRHHRHTPSVPILLEHESMTLNSNSTMGLSSDCYSPSPSPSSGSLGKDWYHEELSPI